MCQKKLNTYINEVLGMDLKAAPFPKDILGDLPHYIREIYRLYFITFYNKRFLLAEVREEDGFSVSQTIKHLSLLKDILNKKVILVTENITAINRKRLIEKGINFIVPGKQLFMPDMLLDLRESFHSYNHQSHRDTLLPSAQYLLLYHLLHSNEEIENLSFKEIAKKLDYTQMAITKAVKNLTCHKLCVVKGSKEKHIHFNKKGGNLWDLALPFLVNPVLKKVYVDEKPKKTILLQSNASALPLYTDIGPGRQEFYAIGKLPFYKLQKSDSFVNLNGYEGRYCLEVWKYDPEKLAEEAAGKNSVDPLSLYLSLKNNPDERIEASLDKIIENFPW